MTVAVLLLSLTNSMEFLRLRPSEKYRCYIIYPYHTARPLPLTLAFLLSDTALVAEAAVASPSSPSNRAPSARSAALGADSGLLIADACAAVTSRPPRSRDIARAAAAKAASPCSRRRASETFWACLRSPRRTCNSIERRAGGVEAEVGEAGEVGG